VTTAGGCAKECTKDIIVTAEPDCTISAPDSVCAGSTGNAASTATAGAAHAWSITNGQITSASNAQSITFTAGASGTIKLNLTVTAADGSSKKCSKDIAILPAPDCSWTSNSPVCNSMPVQFDGPSGMDAYSWDFGDGSSSQAEDPSHLYFAPGTYAVKLIMAKCGSLKSCPGTVVVKPVPNCRWTSSSPVCDGTPVQFTGPAGEDAYRWDFGDGQVGSAQSPSHLYRAPDIYTVNLTTTKGGCSNSCLGVIRVRSYPDCRWTSNSPVCNDTPVQFTGPAGMEDYQWDFGDGAVGSAKDPVHLYSAPGSYTVNLKATKDGCSKECSKDITVTAGPDCTISAPDAVCAGSTGNAASTATTGAAYAWSITNGEITSASNTQSIAFTAGASGTVGLKVKVTNANGCAKECSKDITVTAGPDCTISAPSSVCAGSTGNAASTAASGAAYVWSITNGEITSASDRQSITFTAGASGTTRLEVTVTAGGCSKKCSKDITITSGPDCTISAPDAVCAGSTGNAASTAASGAAYVWSITNGEITSASNTQSIAFTAGALGTTRLEVTVTAGGCSKKCSKDITVTAGPDCTWTSNAPVCNGAAVQFTGPAGMDFYQWDFGDGAASSAKDPSHLYSAAGTYTVNLKATKSGCSKSCTGTVVVNSQPDCSWTASAPVCSGTPVQFTGPAGMDAYQWDFGDGGVSSSKDPSHPYSAPGTYTVSLKTTKSGCSKSCPGSVVVKSQPDCSWTSNSPVCNGTPVQLTGPSGVDSYQWEFGDGQASSVKDPSHLYRSPGTYTVNLKATKSGCSKSCPGTVEVRAPDCSWTSNAPVCNGTPVQFTGPSGMESYQWDFGDGQVSSAKDPSHLYSGPGTYSVNLKATKGGCSKSCMGSVMVKSQPDCGWTSNAPVCEGTPVRLTGPSGMESYQWEFGDGAVSSAKDPSHLYSAPGTYTVNLKATKGGCSKICKGTVKVRPLASCRQPPYLDWQKCLGGSSYDYAQSIQQTADGGYVVCGYTPSNDGDVSGNHGSEDFWIVKLSEINCTISAPDAVYSGSTGNAASTAESGASYAWAITNGAITSASYTQSISFAAGTSGTTRLTVNVTRPGSWDRCYKDIAIKPKPDSSRIPDRSISDSLVQLNESGMESHERDSGDGQASSRENKVRIYPG